MTKKIMRPLCLTACFIMLFSHYAVAASIKGSKHDFSSPAAAGKSKWSGFFNADSVLIEEICVFCHTPHNAAPAATYGVLWNRVNQGGYSWNMYTSATLTSAVPPSGPTGISLMCMSCHDGVTSIGVGVLQNAPGSGNPAVTFDTVASGIASDKIGEIFYVGEPLLGAGPNIADGNPYDTVPPLDMRNDHPISFDWPTGDSGLYAASARGNQDKLRLFGTSGIRVECATCHSVHNNAIPPFLAMSNAGSGMCLSCHNK